MVGLLVGSLGLGVAAGMATSRGQAVARLVIHNNGSEPNRQCRSSEGHNMNNLKVQLSSSWSLYVRKTPSLRSSKQYEVSRIMLTTHVASRGSRTKWFSAQKISDLIVTASSLTSYNLQKKIEHHSILSILLWLFSFLKHEIHFVLSCHCVVKILM